MGEKSVRVELDEGLLAQLDDRARKEGRSLTELIRTACRLYIEASGQEPSVAAPRGALALVGAWGDVSDEEIDTFIADVYSERSQDKGRAVDLEP